jgi:phosphoglycerate dehydrogenase-like enzyme
MASVFLCAQQEPVMPETFRIIAVDPLPARLKDLFLQQLPSGNISFRCPETAHIEELTTLAAEANALVTRQRLVTGRIMCAAGAKLRLVQVMGRLPDHVDLNAARAAGVAVAVMPHGGAIAVAEHAMALMLALARRLVAGHLGVAAGSYRNRGLEPTPTSEWSFAFNWLGFKDMVELRGRTLGIVGMGEIGKELARRARAFDMPVIYHDLNRLPEQYELLLGARQAPLDDLLAEADIISLHVPHTDETERMLDARRLGLMKPTAFLINAARGGLIDEAALSESLRHRKIAGAGLDVFAVEPLSEDHPFCTLDNVILSPHIGGGAGGGQRLLVKQVLDNIVAVAAGRRPQNVVVEGTFLPPGQNAAGPI